MIIEHLKSIDSTNSELKRRLINQKGEYIAAVRADAQQHGRGRMSRVWLNTDKAVLLSICFPIINLDPSFFSSISLVASLAVHDVIIGSKSHYEHKTGIKWPNDILLCGKKVCGIMTELVYSADKIPHSVVGIGINVCDYPSGELETVTTSLKRFYNCRFDLNDISRKIADRLMERKGMSLTLQIKEFSDKCVTLGKDITVYPVASNKYEACALKIDEYGRLVVRDSSDSIISLSSADVSIRWED